MASPRSLFQTAVDKATPRRARENAIDALTEVGAMTQLRVVAVTSGLAGPYRRQAVNGLGRCRATDELERLVDDIALDNSIRELAREKR